MTPSHAAETLKNWAARYSDLIELAAMLDRLGSVEAAIAESEQRKVVAQQAEAIAVGELDAARRALDEARAQARDTRDRAQAGADRISTVAEERIAAQESECVAMVGKVLADAEAQAKVRMATADAEIDALREDGRKARAVLAEVAEQTEAKRKELADYEARLNAARAEIKKLLR